MEDRPPAQPTETEGEPVNLEVASNLTPRSEEADRDKYWWQILPESPHFLL